MYFVDAGVRLGRNFTEFKNRWFNTIMLDAYRTICMPTDFAEEQIKGRIRDLTMTIQAKDYFDLPDMLINKIKVRLPPKAWEQYREMEKEMFTEVNTHGIEAVNSGSKSMKCRQLASGAVYTDKDSNWTLAHDAKMDYLHDIVGELNGAALVIAYQFKSDLARLKSAFPKGREYSPANKLAFMRGEFQIMFAHPASAGHGIDGMQVVCNNMVIFSMTWNLEEFQQIMDRINPVRQLSAGFDRDVYISLLIGENTVEEEMSERLESKATLEESMALAMKRRGS
jgi:hypothetical protein